MKNFILSSLLLFLFSGATSQTQNPVKWQAAYKAISATEGEIVITAEIEKGWHTYSQRPTDAGPIPTSFKFAPSKDYDLVGKTEESNAHEEYVKAFEAKIFVFNGKAEFKQKVKVKKKGAVITLKVEYMCCNDMMCLPPKTFDLTVKAQ
jgi:DsbC/DsbD-like thiol-disulfide interchange protein